MGYALQTTAASMAASELVRQERLGKLMARAKCGSRKARQDLKTEFRLRVYTPQEVEAFTAQRPDLTAPVLVSRVGD